MKISVVAGAMVALALANTGLFVMVDAHSGGAAASASSDSVASVTPTTTGSSSSSASSTGPATPSATARDGSGVFVVAVSGTRAWRVVSSGGCSGSVQVAATRNGGRTWTGLAKPPVAAANGIGIDENGRLVINGRRSNGCASGTWSLSGGAWFNSSPSTWLRTGGRTGEVTQGGHKLTACDNGWVADLATSGSSGVDVLCSTGDVRSVSSGGATKTIYRSADVISIGTTADNSLVVARTVNGCDGVELDEIKDGTPQRITCLQGASGTADLTFTGDNGWFVTAHGTWTGGPSGSWSKS